MSNHIRAAMKARDAEKVVYYRQTESFAACVTFESFKRSSAYEAWQKKHAEVIEAQLQEFKRFGFLG